MEDRQVVPRPGVGDETEAGAKNNQGASKQNGTTSEAVRSPKPHVQPIAKKKVQKETAIPSKVPPTERKKAKKKQGLGKGKEKAVSVGFQKPHKNILAQKMQGAEIQKETAGSSEDPCMENKMAKKKPGSEKPKETAMPSKVFGSQIIYENCDVEKMQGFEKKKIPSLNELSRMLLEDDCATELPKPKVDGTGNEKAKQQQAKRANGEGFPCEAHREDEDTAEDSFDQLNEYEKRGTAKLTLKVKEEEKEIDLVNIYDSSDKEEAKQDQEEVEDEGEEEESGEEEEKSICEEGEEEEDEGGDEERADDEEEGVGSIGDDEDSKNDGEGSGDDKKGDEEVDSAESTDGSDEGDGVGAKVEEAEASSGEETTPKSSAARSTPRAAVALASMKESFTRGLCFESMDSLLYNS
ncbi:hypothetical protein L7F22_056238 [Adiantum nelumboides]|nr:hypothetical protein [Adiantum nelumboides]